MLSLHPGQLSRAFVLRAEPSTTLWRHLCWDPSYSSLAILVRELRLMFGGQVLGSYRPKCSPLPWMPDHGHPLSCPEPHHLTCTKQHPYLRGLVMLGDDAEKVLSVGLDTE